VSRFVSGWFGTESYSSRKVSLSGLYDTDDDHDHHSTLYFWIRFILKYEFVRFPLDVFEYNCLLGCDDSCLVQLQSIWPIISVDSLKVQVMPTSNLSVKTSKPQKEYRWTHTKLHGAAYQEIVLLRVANVRTSN
jgi:hypothetical protein